MRSLRVVRDHRVDGGVDPNEDSVNRFELDFVADEPVDSSHFVALAAASCRGQLTRLLLGVAIVLAMVVVALFHQVADLGPDVSRSVSRALNTYMVGRTMNWFERSPKGKAKGSAGMLGMSVIQARSVRPFGCFRVSW